MDAVATGRRRYRRHQFHTRRLEMPVTIVGALLPAAVTLLPGFFAAWRHDFDAEQGATLNGMVFRYALPLSLFVTTLGASLDNLVAQLPLAAVITSTMIASYLIVLLVARWIFHRDIMTAALQAL